MDVKLGIYRVKYPERIGQRAVEVIHVGAGTVMCRAGGGRLFSIARTAAERLLEPLGDAEGFTEDADRLAWILGSLTRDEQALDEELYGIAHEARRLERMGVEVPQTVRKLASRSEQATAKVAAERDDDKLFEGFF